MTSPHQFSTFELECKTFYLMNNYLILIDLIWDCSLTLLSSLAWFVNEGIEIDNLQITWEKMGHLKFL